MIGVRGVIFEILWIFRKNELGRAGVSRPEPAGAGPRSNRVDFLEISTKNKNKKVFSRFWEGFLSFLKIFYRFGRFCLPDPREILGRLPNPLDWIDSH